MFHVKIMDFNNLFLLYRENENPLKIIYRKKGSYTVVHTRPGRKAFFVCDIGRKAELLGSLEEG